MIHRTFPKASRRGAVAPLVAILMIIVLAMVAFAVDVGYMYTARTELQAAADSCALAGASQLYNWGGIADPLYGPATQNSAQLGTARTEARKFSGLNRAGSVNLTNLPDSDIEFGYLSPSSPNEVSNQSVQMHAPPSGTTNNSVRVTSRRDSLANTPLRLFFAPLLGTSAAEIRASATATYLKTDVFKSRKFIPLMIKKHNTSSQVPKHVFWDSTSDRTNWYAFDRNDETLFNGTDDNPEYKLRTPVDNDSEPNHAGVAFIGSSANNTTSNMAQKAADIRRQLNEGPSDDDFAQLSGGKLQTGQWLKGFSTDQVVQFKNELQALVGKPRIALIYDTMTDGDSGKTAKFNIVGFCSMVVCEVAQETASGKQRLRIRVQPEVVYLEDGRFYVGSKVYEAKLTR